MALLERLPQPKLISQRSVYHHVDVAGVYARGRAVVFEPSCRHAVLCRGRADLALNAQPACVEIHACAGSQRAEGRRAANRRRPDVARCVRWAFSKLWPHRRGGGGLRHGRAFSAWM